MITKKEYRGVEYTLTEDEDSFDSFYKETPWKYWGYVLVLNIDDKQKRLVKCISNENKNYVEHLDPMINCLYITIDIYLDDINKLKDKYKWN